MRWTIGRKLGVVIGVGLAGLAVIAGAGWRGIHLLDTAFSDAMLTSGALRSHTEADRMHEGIRADVLRILAAETDEELSASTQGLGEHITRIKELMEENEKLPLPADIQAALRDAQPELAAYVEAAEAITVAARRDRDGMRRKFARFQEQFEALQEKLSGVSAQIAEDLANANERAHATSLSARREIALLAFLTTVLSAALTFPISRGMVRSIGQAQDALAEKAAALNESSTELSIVSQRMNTAAGETVGQASAVASAAAEATHSIETVSIGMEEMGSAIQAITRSAMEANEVVAGAVTAANSASNTIQRLGTSSVAVGAVIKVITSIAEQTNLLALNATIEAARAGDMGRGFAAVANEVKELANETARATEEIGRRIEAIQRDSTDAVVAISQVSQVIGRIYDLQGAIAAAVEQQTATTARIKRNVVEVARASGRITSTITQVAAVADRSTESAGETRQAAQVLAELAAELRGLASGFRHTPGDQGVRGETPSS